MFFAPDLKFVASMFILNKHMAEYYREFMKIFTKRGGICIDENQTSRTLRTDQCWVSLTNLGPYFETKKDGPLCL